MKNILVSILIFLVMLFSINHSTKYLNTTCRQLIKLSDTMEEIVHDGNWNKAYDLSTTLLDKWKNEYRTLSIFVHHAEIDNINSEFLQLTQYTKCRDKTESLSKIHLIKFYLNNIIEEQKINIQNIF